MSKQLRVAIGQCSEAGRKPLNQDFHGALIPPEPQRSSKGIAVALADGISSSEVSQIASESAVAGFLEDYFSTPETWSVKHSAHRVLMATNSWLYAQTRQSPYRYDLDRGYVCTFTTLVFKSATAHLFHIGDSRVYRLSRGSLEQLTEDHRLGLSGRDSCLSRALGADSHVEVDYRALSLATDDVFLLLTDGVYEVLTGEFMAATVLAHWDDPDEAASELVSAAYDQGSTDNLTAQIVRVQELPESGAAELHQELRTLPFPPPLREGERLDGYRILRQVHASSRSHVYLAEDEHSGERVALKTLSTELQQDPLQIERFVTEEWIARRIDHPQVVSAPRQPRTRSCLYTVMEFIEGQTLRQWMIDHPEPDLAQVRDLVEQIGRALRAFHRQQMLHQDLRPDNVMIDRTGTVRLIDFGAARVAGVMEMAPEAVQETRMGTAQYSAPEYFMGEAGSSRSDLFSLAVITYQMLSGQLPYGTEVARTYSRSTRNRLRYRPLGSRRPDLPHWLDGVLKRALHPDPNRRFQALSEFIFELRHPSRAYTDPSPLPLVERHPVRFWQGVSLVLAVTVVGLLVRLLY